MNPPATIAAHSAVCVSSSPAEALRKARAPRVRIAATQSRGDADRAIGADAAQFHGGVSGVQRCGAGADYRRPSSPTPFVRFCVRRSVHGVTRDEQTGSVDKRARNRASRWCGVLCALLFFIHATMQRLRRRCAGGGASDGWRYRRSGSPTIGWGALIIGLGMRCAHGRRRRCRATRRRSRPMIGPRGRCRLTSRRCVEATRRQTDPERTMIIPRSVSFSPLDAADRLLRHAAAWTLRAMPPRCIGYRGTDNGERSRRLDAGGGMGRGDAELHAAAHHLARLLDADRRTLA